jgi:hypothetical protein
MKTIGERHLENFLPIVSCTVNARGKLMPWRAIQSLSFSQLLQSHLARESSKATHQSDEEEGALIGGGGGGGSWLAIRHGLGSHPDCGLNLRLVYEYMGPIILIRTPVWFGALKGKCRVKKNGEIHTCSYCYHRVGQMQMAAASLGPALLLNPSCLKKKINLKLTWITPWINLQTQWK